MASLITGNKFDPDKDIPDLNGKVYVVTGGSAGIGFGIVLHLLQHNPAKIYLLSNKEEHADEAQEKLAKHGDISKVHWMRCDLSNLKHTDEVAEKLSSLDRLDVLVCNAGLGVGKYWETQDGIDSHMQVNHISQFHLALTLLPVLLRTPHSRLVLQSSDMHRLCPAHTRFLSLSELNDPSFGPTNLYTRSKLAQILFLCALARRMSASSPPFSTNNNNNRVATGPWMNATHPGAVATDQPRQAEEAYGVLGKVGVALATPFMVDPVDQGCRPALFAAAGEAVAAERIQGQYIVPDRKVSEPSDQAKDEELQENLWKLTVQILKDKLGTLRYGT